MSGNEEDIPSNSETTQSTTAIEEMQKKLQETTNTSLLNAIKEMREEI